MRGPSAPSIAGAIRIAGQRVLDRRAGARRRSSSKSSSSYVARFDEPRRPRRLATSLQRDERVAHPRQRLVERGQRDEVEATALRPQLVEVDLVERLGDGAAAVGAGVAHVVHGAAGAGRRSARRRRPSPTARRVGRWRRRGTSAPRRTSPRRRRSHRSRAPATPSSAVVRPLREVVAGLHGGVARTRRRRAPAKSTRTHETRPRQPAQASRAGATMPSTNTTSADRHADRRRRAERPAELGPGEHVERDARARRRGPRVRPPGRARPTARRRGRRRRSRMSSGSTAMARATPAAAATAHHGARAPTTTMSATPTPTRTASVSGWPVGSAGPVTASEPGEDGERSRSAGRSSRSRRCPSARASAQLRRRDADAGG